MAQPRKKLICQRPAPQATATATVTGKLDHWRVAGLCLVLAAMTFAVFGQTLHHEFVNFDDNEYVYENPMVLLGLTLKGVAWAFTHTHADNWHPLTWLSHEMDCQLYGLKNPGGHHLTNVLLHTATVILLFLVLRQMTGALWRSAFVAAVFAIHPLRVESVAWVSERKDVLSALFFMLTIGAYVRYANGCKVQSSKFKVFYVLTVLSFALGLLCKPMLVTLPVVLLLLDYWPLHRVESRKISELVLEKAPLLLLSAASCGVTLLAQAGAIRSTASFPVWLRLANAVVVCMVYLAQMVWPAGLAAFYPYPHSGLPERELLLAAMLLACLSVIVWRQRLTRPWLLVGWLWYLVMLLPVAGLVQAGQQAHADRYTYLPQIGIYVGLTWLAAEAGAKWKAGRAALASLMTGALAVLMFCAWQQTAYWKDSEALWTHTLACTTNNAVAQYGLANDLLVRGKVVESINHLQNALQLKPDYAEAHFDLGNALRQTGNVDEAILEYQKALQCKPDYAAAHLNLGNFRLQKGNVDEAALEYQKALQIDPDYVEAHRNLGLVLIRQGRLDDAITHFQQALKIMPGYAMAHVNLSHVLLRKGRIGEAMAHFRLALQINPVDPDVQNELAWLLATSEEASLRNGSQAVELAQQANTLTGGQNPGILQTLAAALAEVGQFGEAVRAIHKAVPLAQATGQQDLAAQLNLELKRYEAGLPLHP